MALHVSLVIPCTDKSGKVIGEISRDIRNAEIVPQIGSTIKVLKDLKLKVVNVEYSGQFPSLDLIWVVLEEIELTGEIKSNLNDAVKAPFDWTWALKSEY
jgi:hypothetical protein